jgi:hypothetical protein
VTIGSVEPMKALHRKWHHAVHFADIIIRQGHPGPENPAYSRLEEKFEDARAYVREDGITWPVLVDDLEGTVHRRFGMLADPAYLIDRDGRVAFYNLWTHVPTLDTAITALVDRGGRGVVLRGAYRVPRPGATLTDGWRGLERGLPQSVTDLETAAPGMASAPWLGHQLRPLLAPITLRAEPLPRAARLGIVAAGVAVLAALVYRRRLPESSLGLATR